MTTKTLIQSKLQPTGEGQYELAILKSPSLKLATLTTLEESELIRAHKAPNFDRARMVKTLMGRGCSQAEIVRSMAGLEDCTRGKVCGDIAALQSAGRKADFSTLKNK